MNFLLLQTVLILYLSLPIISTKTEGAYLDTEEYKGERFEISGIFDFRLHVKTTETYQYLPTSSAHPRHTFKSITTGEVIR